MRAYGLATVWEYGSCHAQHSPSSSARPALLCSPLSAPGSKVDNRIYVTQTKLARTPLPQQPQRTNYRRTCKCTQDLAAFRLQLSACGSRLTTDRPTDHVSWQNNSQDSIARVGRINMQVTRVRLQYIMGGGNGLCWEAEP